MCLNNVPRIIRAELGSTISRTRKSTFIIQVCEFVYSMFEYVSQQSVSRSVVFERQNSSTFNMLFLLQ